MTVIACDPPPGSESEHSHDRLAAQTDVPVVLGAHGGSTSPSDVNVIATFSDLPARWNRAAAPLVRDYLDPNIPADRWVEDASHHIGELRAVWFEMHACILAIQDPGIRNILQEIEANYGTKLGCLTALHYAVAQGNQEGEQEAQQTLSVASAEGQRLARTMIERLRPYVDPQVLTDRLKKRGKEIGELMKPR